MHFRLEFESQETLEDSRHKVIQNMNQECKGIPKNTRALTSPVQTRSEWDDSGTRGVDPGKIWDKGVWGASRGNFGRLRRAETIRASLFVAWPRLEIGETI